jgi:hypothetical protein
VLSSLKAFKKDYADIKYVTLIWIKYGRNNNAKRVPKNWGIPRMPHSGQRKLPSTLIIAAQYGSPTS